MNIELYNDDCMNVLDTLTHKIDLALFDLPYGQTQCKWDNKIDLTLMWDKLKKISKPTTCFIFFTTTKFGYELIKSNEKWFRYDLIWSKNSSAGFLNCKKMPMRSHEMLYIFYDKLPTYNVDLYHIKTQLNERKSRVNSTIYTGKSYTKDSSYEPKLPTSILDFSIQRSMKKRFHPTEKPIELLKWLIKYYSNENDIVLDITMGSGSTGVAAKELNRYFIGIELNKEYYEVACNRLINNDVVENL